MTLTTEEKKARKRAWHQRNKARIAAKNRTPESREKQRLRARQWHKDHPGANTEYHQRRREAAAGRPRPGFCEICGTPKKKLHFDHCHQRGVFRGWICFSCNSVLGHVNDDPDRLRKLIAYLERTKTLISPQLELPV